MKTERHGTAKRKMGYFLAGLVVSDAVPELMFP